MKAKAGWILTILSMIALLGCATYYQRYQEYFRLVQNGQFADAQTVLEKSRKAKKARYKTLFLLNKGFTDFMQGNYEASNSAFLQADLLIETYRNTLGTQALALIANPGVRPYMAEDFEQVFLRFYTAFGFLQQFKYESALVEARRINLLLTDLSTRYKSERRSYTRDAFAHLLMGYIYENDRDYNNAFIAYRNAESVFEEVYEKEFATPKPTFLGQDLIRTARLSGLPEEVQRYGEKYGAMEAEKEAEAYGIFFWSNGFGPIKDETSLDFYIIPLGSGNYQFVNNILNISLVLNFGSLNDQQQKALENMKVIRMAFPRYLRRPAFFNKADVEVDGIKYPFELVQNVDAIAKASLRDRLWREAGQALMRLATRKAIEVAARSQNNTAGDIFAIAGAIAERADTRNWQTLPAQVYVTRIPLKTGSNTMRFKAYHPQSGRYEERELTINHVQKGRVYFINYHTLPSLPPMLY